MRDPYEVLGVGRNADAAAIKSAYRKLAKKLHPDANKNDPKSAQRFAEVNAAYEILGEAERRKAFDRGAEGKPRFRGFEGFGRPRGGGHADGDFSFEQFSFGPEGFKRSTGRRGGGFSNFEDVLSNMFGHASRGSRGRERANIWGSFEDDLEAPARDVAVALTITLAEAFKGGTKRVRLPNGKELDVKIPAGLADGRQIRLKGQGLPSPDGIGDVLITVTIAPHPFFKVEGADLRVDVPITLYEAVLGGKIRVPTLDGAVDINLPAGTNGGRTFRIQGKGMRAGGQIGDLYATMRIALPDKADREFEELMRKWRDAKPYNPRRDIL
jgi:DnaJ-class molecular chaperone